MSAVYTQFLWRAPSTDTGGLVVPVFIADSIHRTVATTVSIGIGVNIVPGSATIYAPGPCAIASIAAQAGDVPIKRTAITQYARWVMAEGDEMFIQTEGGWTADFYCSGFLLSLP